MTPAAPITLYGSGTGFDLPDKSPFVLKTEMQLKMAGLAYRKHPGNRDSAPKGKLPYLEDEGERIADSTFIRAHIERKYELDLDEGLTPRQRAESWAIERLLEDHLYWALLYYRWVDPDNFAKGPAHFVDNAPEDKRAQLRIEIQARVTDNLRIHGLGRHTPEEVLELGKRSLSTLAALLGDQPFFIGARPTAIDATAFAMLAGVLTPFFTSPLRDAAEHYPNLVAYTDRMMQRYFPDQPWTTQASQNARAAAPF
ncbi:glutathione S-transferase family protein [Dyella subtropica]|uniref:glutathione S-transferase family protein n=1 Tax=Dyella subtropica TaxID=2992127 RepID=UPI0022542324|nr:glutathione S-transferase family protein [Dyella subtropica]